MSRKRYSAELLIGQLRQAEILVSGGKTIAEVVRQLNISEQTYYRRRKEYGVLDVDQARRLKELEQENGRLKRLVADQALDISILKEACRVLGQVRRTQRYTPKVSGDEAALTADIVFLASECG